MPTYDTTTVPGVRILEGTNPVADVDAGLEAMAEDLGSAYGSFSAAHLFTNAGTPVIAIGTDVVIWTSEQWDPSSWFNLATGKFTPQVAGYYHFNSGVTLVGETGLTIASLQLDKNGSTDSHVVDEKTVAAGTRIVLSGSTAYQMNGSTDYVAARVNHNDTDSIAVDFGYFNGALIGRS